MHAHFAWSWTVEDFDSTARSQLSFGTKSGKYRGRKWILIVENLVLVEIKTVPRLRPVHRAQVISYLKTTGLRVGILMNFNVGILKQGLQRVIC